MNRLIIKRKTQDGKDIYVYKDNGEPVRGNITLTNGRVYNYDNGNRTFVRYADGTPNYDRFPVGSYIRTIENADRAEKHKEYWKNNLKLGGIIKKKRFDK